MPVRRRKKALEKALHERLQRLTEHLDTADVSEKSIDIVKEIKELHALAAARAQSSAILMARMQTDLVQTGAFAASEFATFAQAGLFTTWAAGQTYARGYRLVHRGIVYEVLQDVTALADQPPDAAGMPAVYRPLSVAPESGDGQADSPGQAASSRDRSATSSIAEASCA